jgi:uncharacterized delta-60 repeat protein
MAENNKKVNVMFKQILATSFFIIFVILACETGIESGELLCVPEEDTCPDGMKCAQVGTDSEFRCYDESLFECGDNILHEGEECDGTHISETILAAKCSGAPIKECSDNCVIICDYCGNGVIDATGDEVCDGSNTGNSSCSDIEGFHGYNDLSCNANCTFNTDLCEYCGDGTISGTETCEGTDFNHKPCIFGTQTCSSISCNISTDTCFDIIQWGTENIEYGTSIALDSINNIYVFGYGTSSMGDPLFGSFSIILTKYSSNGNFEWTKKWGTTRYDWGLDIAIDSNDYIYVTGYTRGSMDGTNLGDYDLFLTKYSTDGSLVYTKQWGTDDVDKANGIAIDSNNNIYITGYTMGSLDGTNLGLGDLFLTKYTSDGSLVWNLQWGTNNYDGGEGIMIDSNNNIYVTGCTKGDINGTNLEYCDIILSKYTPDGTIIWTKQWGTDQIDFGKDIAIDSNNNIYVTGRTDGSMDGTNLGNHDPFLTKYTNDGSFLWTRQLTTIDYGTGNSIVIDSSDNIFLTGSVNNLDGTNFGEYDLFLAKYTPDGTFIQIKQWGTDTDDHSKDIAINSSGTVYITGYTNGNLGEQNLGYYDLFILGTNTSSEN